MIHHYPLQWPIGWPRTKYRQLSQFKVGYEEAEKHLAGQLERLGVTSAYISTDQPLRMDGRPRRDQPAATSGVAVYFVRKGVELCIPCDKFGLVRENLRAVGLTIENIRQMERYGTSQVVEAALSGFAALPAHSIITPPPAMRNWWDILEVQQTASIEVIRAAYKQRALKLHPDVSAEDSAAFIELNRAYKQAQEERG
jgi:hypothetical protein